LALVVSEGDSESMALVPLEDVDEGVHTSGSHELSHEALELVESILQEKFDTSDFENLDALYVRREVGKMVFEKAVASGVLLMLVALCWWLTISVFGNQLGSEDATLSLIFSLNYKWVAAAVPILVFGATALMKLSRERRQPWPGFAAGAMLILALFMAIEPIGHLAFGGAPAIMLVHSARLIVLGVMVYYSATMFIDSLLLRWVHDLLEVGVVGLLGDFDAEGQAEEAEPLA
jgi:hypothetical protein